MLTVISRWEPVRRITSVVAERGLLMGNPVFPAAVMAFLATLLFHGVALADLDWMGDPNDDRQSRLTSIGVSRRRSQRSGRGSCSGKAQRFSG